MMLLKNLLLIMRYIEHCTCLYVCMEYTCRVLYSGVLIFVIYLAVVQFSIHVKGVASVNTQHTVEIECVALYQVPPSR